MLQGNLNDNKEKQTIKSQFLSKQAKPLGPIFDLPYQLTKNLSNQEKYYFLYEGVGDYDGPYLSDDVKRPIGNMRFRIANGGYLIFEGREIFISKD